MRYIPTSAATVDGLKRQAKKLQRTGGGKHADLLNRVAQQAGYLHWHHVTLCLKEFEAKQGLDALNAECDLVISAALSGTDKIVVTGPETLTVPLVLFASQGDAWLLDAEERVARCLVWHGQAQERVIADKGEDIEVEWDGNFSLDGNAFAVDTQHATIGKRVIAGYPLDDLRKAIERAQSFDKRFAAIFGQGDAQDLTPDSIENLVHMGWDRKVLEAGARNGDRYSPGRNSLLSLPVAGGFDEEGDEPPTAA